MLNAVKSSLLVASLTLGCSGCAQDVEFDARSIGMQTHLKPLPVTVPGSHANAGTPGNSAADFAPLPQCLGELSHPTYRRDLPPQPEKAVTGENTAAGCEIENGVLYRFSSPEDIGNHFGPTVDLHGIGI